MKSFELIGDLPEILPLARGVPTTPEVVTPDLAEELKSFATLKHWAQQLLAETGRFSIAGDAAQESASAVFNCTIGVLETDAACIGGGFPRSLLLHSHSLSGSGSFWVHAIRRPAKESFR